MGKISNKTLYPALDPASLDDFLVITDADTTLTRTITIGGIGTLTGGLLSVEGEMSNSATFQHDDLIGAQTVFPFVNGVDTKSGGFFSSFESDIGTITFTSNQTGNILVGYA